MSAGLQTTWRGLFLAYFLLLSWQLLTPVTVVSPGSWDKLIHFSAFFVLAVLATLGWRSGGATSRILLLLGYAAATELLQHFIPGRSFSLLDWLADGLGTVSAVVLSLQALQRLPQPAKAH